MRCFGVAVIFLLGVCFAVVAHSAQSEKNISKQECRDLGFITDELYCNTCEILLLSIEESDLSSSLPNRNTLYSECLACCKPPSEAFEMEQSNSEEEMKGGKNKNKYSGFNHLYVAARIEISFYTFNGDEKWKNFIEKDLSSAFPPKNPKVPSTAAVFVVPGHSMKSYIHLYNEGQDPIKGTPTFSIDVQTWDERKILEFLNNTIISSPLLNVKGEEVRDESDEL
eukprot:Tbor_TRINITY_DN3810_c0_g1::TRINITY_DN3810_c0_g1_i1::g.5693::m.5693